MTVQEFISKIDNGEAKVLTVETAKGLKGKKIAWLYFGYEGNENIVREMIVGDVVSNMAYHEAQPMDGWKSRADYWRSYMKPEKLKKQEDTLLLLDANGKWPYISACPSKLYKELTFTCSDGDREVYYFEL